MSKINYESFAINAFNHVRHNLDEYENEENWVVANRLFKCGSGNAISFCHELGIDPNGYGPAKTNETSDGWISVEKIENLPEQDQPVLVTVCNKDDEFWFVDIGRYHNQEGYPLWNTNIGLDDGEEVTHFKINNDLNTPAVFNQG
ncbi:DUF551 domain-containing protein [Acinetobacter guerrae]|uniref:DUF551 domain-containing protein n=1 Tax=Acinetobacter guerrae TaxID=1843371 RepID=UPI00125EB058|nr:DUF551 domain-containing protein [Acinetobacter guerrae]